MPRQAVNTRRRSRPNPFGRHPKLSSLFRTFLLDDILPPRSSHPNRFLQNDIFGNLYVSDREWADDIDPSFFSEATAATEVATRHHEEYLDYLFWDSSAQNRWICILGDVGTGKSTLVDYYLRCHCPNDGKHSADFHKKVIIHCNAARSSASNSDLFYNLWHTAQASIKQQCAVRNFDIESAIARRPYIQRDIRQWVYAALEEISRNSSSPFGYVVVLLDNLDQCRADVQKRAIGEVQSWLESTTMRIWRVVVPLWPATYHSLQTNSFSLLRGATKFTIGPLKSSSLIDNRVQALQGEVSRIDDPIGLDCIDFLETTRQLYKNVLLDRIQILSHSDLRRQLRFLHTFWTGDAAYVIWKQIRSGYRRSFEYELLDAQILGAGDVLQNDLSRLANIFDVGHAHATPRDLLVGIHALFVLSNGVTNPRSFYAIMRNLGYSQDNSTNIVHQFHELNVLHDAPAFKGVFSTNDTELMVHSSVVGAYLQLAIEPAYLDNIAVVTPVDDEYRSRISVTRSDVAADFQRRAESTIEFIDFVRDNEERFVKELPVGCDSQQFTREVKSMQIPKIWRRMAFRYRERLEALRRSGYLHQIEKEWWEKVLAHRLFQHADTADDLLL